MRLKLIACKALYRELSLISSVSKNFVDATFIKQGLHDTPSLLNEILKEEIRKIDEGNDIHSAKPEYGRDFDAILFGYGLCSNGIIGLTSKKYPIVVPRAHDCISLFLGSYEKYMQEYNKNSGTYWYTASWIENAPNMPSEENKKVMYEHYVQQYGEENADFLLNSMLAIDNYSRAAYVEWDELKFPEYEQFTKDAADFYGWDFEKIKGSKDFLQDFVYGKWDERFLVVEPGQEIVADYSGKVVKCGQYCSK